MSFVGNPQTYQLQYKSIQESAGALAKHLGMWCVNEEIDETIKELLLAGKSIRNDTILVIAKIKIDIKYGCVGNIQVASTIEASDKLIHNSIE